MSEHENELKKALAENGTLDPEKAERLAADAVSRFRAGLKKTERLMWIYLVACMAVMLFAFMAFQSATSVKMMIGFGILLLLAYETTILMKLWYWIVNTKLALLKAIKQLQLQTASAPSSSDTGPLEMATGFRQPGLSLWERVLWIAVLVIVALASSYYWGYRTIPGGQPSSPKIETYITLAAEGVGTEVLKVSYPYMGFVPRSSFPFTTTDTDAQIRWVDGKGRQLPATSSTSNGQRHYTVQLVEPVMPGEQVRYTQITEFPALATEKDGLWTCRTSLAFGDSDNGRKPPASQLVAGLPTPAADVKEPEASFWETIQLPKGAEIVTVDPQPVMQGTCVWGSVPARGFGATRGRNDAFTCTIQYRLPGRNAPQRALK